MGELASWNPDQVPGPLSESVVDWDYYMENYMLILPRYIGRSRPAEDTLRTYQKGIRSFLIWCIKQPIHPKRVEDYQMRFYVESLTKSGYRPATLGLYVTAVRTFYRVAMRLGLVQDNPCADIQVPSPFTTDRQFTFFTPEQEGEIIEAMEQEPDEVSRTRGLAILYLMGVEGLRKVEVHRMNDEDIHLDEGYIFIHGKGHDGTIYPSPETCDRVREYIACRPEPKKDGLLTPTFISLCRRTKGQRLSRFGIGEIMKKVLRASGYDQKGIACHVFRHSCGTNLYAATKDIRIVQETLRQRDPKVTARYAHVHQRMSSHYTSAIVPRKKDDK